MIATEAPATTVLLRLNCQVTDRHAYLGAAFERSFCRSLGRYLEQETAVRIAHETDTRARQLSVLVTIVSPFLADVVISERGGKEVRSRLASYDRSLSVGSAGTLVRPIALKLGLIDE